MKKFLCTALICILIPFISVQRIFADEENPDLPFTDVIVDQLVNITSSVDSTWLNMLTEKKTVIDEVIVEQSQGQFTTLRPSSNNLYITGTYHDNTITGVTQCTSSSYNYSSQNHTIDGVAVVEIDFGTGLNHNSSNMILNAALDVGTNVGASETVTTNSFTNTSEACALMGMNAGDKGVDGTTLIQLGYEQHTVTYNDGTSAGHTATVYVPGNESISLGIDASYINNLVNNIVINFINSAIYIYHNDYSLYLQARSGHYIPSFGQLKSRSYIGNFFSPLDFDDFEASFDPYLSGEGVTASYNDTFDYNTFSSQDGAYYANQVTLTWQGNDNPYWYFTGTNKTVHYEDLVNDYVNSNIETNIQSQCLTQNWGIVSSSMVEDYPDLTVGYRYGRNATFYNYSFYKLQDSGRLGLFNQLGNFLNNWFGRIKQSIDSISGNSDIVQEIENDYNIDFDTDIDTYITNIQTTSQNIDLTAPQNNLPSGNHLSEFAPIVSETIKVFTDNNIWIFIFVPIVIAILGLIL